LRRARSWPGLVRQPCNTRSPRCVSCVATRAFEHESRANVPPSDGAPEVRAHRISGSFSKFGGCWPTTRVNCSRGSRRR
jgi:hypothetical protein